MEEKRKIGLFENKKLLLLIGIILVIIIIVVVIVVTKSKNPDGPNTPDVVLSDEELRDQELIKDKYLEDKKITISNMKYSYNGEKHLLYFEISNSSTQQINLNNYTILLFDKDNNQISAIGGSALGIIAAKDKAVSVVEFTDDISSVRRVEFVK